MYDKIRNQLDGLENPEHMELPGDDEIDLMIEAMENGIEHALIH